MAKKKPERQCISCGIKGEKNNFIRIAKASDGSISLDPTAKADGRGAYICAKAECFDRMSKARRLDRSFRMHVSEETYKRLVEEFNRIEK